MSDEFYGHLRREVAQLADNLQDNLVNQSRMYAAMASDVDRIMRMDERFDGIVNEEHQDTLMTLWTTFTTRSQECRDEALTLTTIIRDVIAIDNATSAPADDHQGGGTYI